MVTAGNRGDGGVATRADDIAESYVIGATSGTGVRNWENFGFRLLHSYVLTRRALISRFPGEFKLLGLSTLGGSPSPAYSG